MPDESASYFRRALGRGFYPEACQGLGRIVAHKGNRAEAERYFLAALDMSRPVGVNGANSFACLANTLAGITGLRDPRADCRGWIATVPMDVPVTPLGNRPLLVFAPRKAEAEQLLQQVFAAIDKRLQPDGVRWREAPRDHQPVGPVRPGVQCVLS